MLEEFINDYPDVRFHIHSGTEMTSAIAWRKACWI